MNMETIKETLTIQTPEHVGFQYTLAGLGTRAMAFFLDTAIRVLFALFLFVVILIVSKWFAPLFSSSLLNLSRNWVMAIGILAYGFLDLGYFLFFEALWSGQTPGKRSQKLRVIRMDGQPIGWLESAIRNILRAVDILSGIYPLGLIVIFLSPRSQRIGDYAAGTVVIIERRRRVPMDRKRLRPSARTGLPDVGPYISALEPDDYQLIRTFLDRRLEMDPTHRVQLAGDLTRRLMERWQLPLSKGFSYEFFLEEVVGAYERSRRAI
jgi:uncharacterized RDD family membrane protein YckC